MSRITILLKLVLYSSGQAIDSGDNFSGTSVKIVKFWENECQVVGTHRTIQIPVLRYEITAATSFLKCEVKVVHGFDRGGDYKS
jgi:hypothetical protein